MQNSFSVDDTVKIYDIFDIDRTGINDEDLNSHDLHILNKILASDNVMEYLNNCYIKSIKYNNEMYVQLVIRYITTIINGELDESHSEMFDEWILNNVFDGWYHLFQHNDNTKTAGVLYYNVLDVYDGELTDIQYENLKKILSVPQVHSVIRSGYTKCGIDESTNGPFCWFLKGSENFDTNIDKIYNTLEPMTNQPSGIRALLKRFSHIFNLNYSYSFSDMSRLKKKVSPQTFLYVIFRILLKLSLKIKHDNQTLTYTYSFPRDNFKMYDCDDTNTKIFILTCVAFVTCYNPQMAIYNNLNDKVTKLQKKINSTKHMKNESYIKSLLTELDKITDMFGAFTRIVTCKDYLDDISEFVDYYIDKNLHMNDDFVGALILSSLREIDFLDRYDISKNKLNFYFDIVGGRINNPHIRYDCMVYLLELIDVKGFMENHIHFLVKTLKYITEVNTHNHLPPNIYHLHFRNIMCNISKICILMNKNDVPKYDENYNIIFKGIHKLSSRIIDFLDIMNEHVNIINDKKELLTNPARLRAVTGKIIDGNMTTITIVLTTLNDILTNVICDIEKLGTELIMPINTLIIQIFRFFSDGKNPIYYIYNKNMEALDIMKVAFNIINTIKDNNIFKREILEYKDMITEMVRRTKFDEKIKTVLNNYFTNFVPVDVNIDINILPQEFIDPILCIQIREPIMIPHVDLIFDKSSIVSQLYHENINPYTREPLTLQDVEKYNTEQSVKEKINIFNIKFDEWKKQNLQ